MAPLARGATLYVTLEPCSTYGRTPPCTKRIIEEGVAKVVIGSMDRNPRHRGAAAGILREAGIEVRTGVLERECDRLNESFFWWITTGRPFVVLKMAMTLDGRIASASGSSKWITGPQAREMVQGLRRMADAVMIGGNTALADDPSLLVRVPEGWPRQPRRIIWTSRKGLPGSLSMMGDGGPAPELAKPQSADEWMEFLARLGGEDVTFLLLEGGGELAASALRAGAVNRIDFFAAPKILCGRGARPVVGGEDASSLEEAIRIDGLETQMVGGDLLIRGYCKNVHGAD